MSHKLIVTRKNGRIIAALYEEEQLIEARVQEEDFHSILGNIYIGKVQNIVSNIQAAFIDIGEERPCYYSMTEKTGPLFISRKSEKKALCIGDELLVQVSREPLKSKAAAVTGNLTFTGKYLVLTSGNKSLGMSSKLKEAERKRLKEVLTPCMSQEFGLVARTNAAGIGEEELIKELELLKGQYRRVCAAAPHRTCKSLLYHSPEGYLKALQDTYMDQMEAIITDDKEIYSQMEEYLKEYQPEDRKRLRFYEDALLPLAALYSLDKRLEEALRPKVWMKSGAYLVIEPTEALTVIDVNTGKFTGKKKLRETYLKINLEAAKEAARQIRLRNLSGIIIIDFIDMEDKEDKDQLLKVLGGYLRNDPVQTVLVDMTPLNLVEITRRKVRKPLIDQL